MSAPVTVKVDPKGRLTIPRRLREELGIAPGDTFFVEADGERTVLRYAKAENPFDVLAEDAEAEYREGKTTNLRAYADEHGISRAAE